MKESIDFLDYLNSNKKSEFISEIQDIINKSELFLNPFYDGEEFKTNSLKKINYYTGEIDDGIRFQHMKGEPKSYYLQQITFIIDMKNPLIN